MPNIWILDEKIEYTYNSSGNLTLEINASWGAINNIWVNTHMHEVTYNSSQNRILDLGYEWIANQWVNSYKDEFFYNMGIVSSEINSQWNDGTNQ